MNLDLYLLTTVTHEKILYYDIEENPDAEILLDKGYLFSFGEFGYDWPLPYYVKDVQTPNRRSEKKTSSFSLIPSYSSDLLGVWTPLTEHGTTEIRSQVNLTFPLTEVLCSWLWWQMLRASYSSTFDYLFVSLRVREEEGHRSCTVLCIEL